MENFTKVLENIGKTASVQSTLFDHGVRLMRSMGISRTLAVALSQKKTRQIERLIGSQISLSCFVMVPTMISIFSKNGQADLNERVGRHLLFKRRAA